MESVGKMTPLVRSWTGWFASWWNGFRVEEIYDEKVGFICSGTYLQEVLSKGYLSNPKEAVTQRLMHYHIRVKGLKDLKEEWSPERAGQCLDSLLENLYRQVKRDALTKGGPIAKREQERSHPSARSGISKRQQENSKGRKKSLSPNTATFYSCIKPSVGAFPWSSSANFSGILKHFVTNDAYRSASSLEKTEKGFLAELERYRDVLLDLDPDFFERGEDEKALYERCCLLRRALEESLKSTTHSLDGIDLRDLYRLGIAKMQQIADEVKAIEKEWSGKESDLKAPKRYSAPWVKTMLKAKEAMEEKVQRRKACEALWKSRTDWEERERLRPELFGGKWATGDVKDRFFQIGLSCTQEEFASWKEEIAPRDKETFSRLAVLPPSIRKLYECWARERNFSTS